MRRALCPANSSCRHRLLCWMASVPYRPVLALRSWREMEFSDSEKYMAKNQRNTWQKFREIHGKKHVTLRTSPRSELAIPTSPCSLCRDVKLSKMEKFSLDHKKLENCPFFFDPSFLYIKAAEVEFVNAVTAGGSVKLLPAV